MVGTEVGWVLQIVEPNVEFHPVNVCLFGVIGVVLVSNRCAQLNYQAWRVLGVICTFYKNCIFVDLGSNQRTTNA